MEPTLESRGGPARWPFDPLQLSVVGGPAFLALSLEVEVHSPPLQGRFMSRGLSTGARPYGPGSELSFTGKGPEFRIRCHVAEPA